MLNYPCCVMESLRFNHNDLTFRSSLYKTNQVLRWTNYLTHGKKSHDHADGTRKCRYNFIIVDRKCLYDMRYFCVVKMNSAINGGGNAFMHKYCFLCGFYNIRMKSVNN